MLLQNGYKTNLVDGMMTILQTTISIFVIFIFLTIALIAEGVLFLVEILRVGPKMVVVS